MEIKAALRIKFCYPEPALLPEEEAASLQQFVDMNRLVSRILQVTGVTIPCSGSCISNIFSFLLCSGIQLSPEARQLLREDPSAYEVVEPDISLAATVKPMNIGE